MDQGWDGKEAPNALEKVIKQGREKECSGQNCLSSKNGWLEAGEERQLRRSTFESQLRHVLATEPWAKDLASLSPPVLACKEAAVRRAWLVWAASPDKGL